MMMVSPGSAESGLQALLELVTDPERVKVAMDDLAKAKEEFVAEQTKLAQLKREADASADAYRQAAAQAAAAKMDAADAVAAVDAERAVFARDKADKEAQLKAREDAVASAEADVAQRNATLRVNTDSYEKAVAAYAKYVAETDDEIEATRAKAEQDATIAANLKADYERKLATLKSMIA